MREQVVGDLGEAGAASHHRCDLVDRALLDDRDVGDDLLGEHVERVAQVAGRLDLAVDHPPGDHGRFEQIAAVLREDRPSRRLADLVAGAADALQSAADRARRLDLDDEVDRAHVDAELERRRGDDRPQLAPLQLVLDHDPLLAGQRPVVRAHQLVDDLAGHRIDDPGNTLLVASSLSLAARRSAARRALQKMIVVRLARIRWRISG